MKGYYGFRGSGKTLVAVEDLKAEYEADDRVVILTNTPLLFGSPDRILLWEQPEVLFEFMSWVILAPEAMNGRFAYIFIDEANLVMPSRFFGDLPRYFLSFLAESRKLNCDIYFTTQHPNRVDVIMRELTESWVHCEKFGKVPTFQNRWFFRRMTEKDLIASTATNPVILGKRFGQLLFFKKLYNTKHIVGMNKNLVPIPPQDTPTIRWLDALSPKEPITWFEYNFPTFLKIFQWLQAKISSPVIDAEDLLLEDGPPAVRLFDRYCDWANSLLPRLRRLIFRRRSAPAGGDGGTSNPPSAGAIV